MEYIFYHLSYSNPFNSLKFTSKEKFIYFGDVPVCDLRLVKHTKLVAGEFGCINTFVVIYIFL